MGRSPIGRSRHRGAVGLLIGLAGVLAVPASASITAAAASTGYTASLIQTSAAETKVAVNPATDIVYLGNLGGQLTVVNGATGAVTATITLSGLLNGIAVDPATDTVYAAVQSGDGTADRVDVINGATNAITTTIPMPHATPLGIAVDASTDTVYVACGGTDAVSVINGATNSVTATVSTTSSGQPYAVTVDESSDVVWVSAGANAVAISGATNSVSRIVKLPGVPDSVAVNPTTDTVYAALVSGYLAVIDGAAGTVSATVAMPSRVYAVATDPGSNVVYAATVDGGVGYGSTLIIDGASKAITDTIARGGYQAALNTANGSVYEAAYQQKGAWVLTPSAADKLSPVISTGPAANFVTGVKGSFTVAASAAPAATFTEAGALPAGVTLSPGGALTGTPGAGTGGLYPITITASNGVAPAYSQSFSLTVGQPPTFSSAANATFRTGVPGSFAVQAHGFPASPTFTWTGALPAGVSLSPSGTLAGTPGPQAGGSYPITITASNGIAPAATQAFTLTVDQAPAFTTPSSATFRAGSQNTFTVRTTGFPAATLSEGGRLPKGVAFTPGRNGTAVLAGQPQRADRGKTFKITIYASNGVGPRLQQTFTLRIT